ncbi:uncharacterized protein LOC143292554 [Babylonia areolata]|uniref:uncharacterized protein LOC143292554 n=1 Tax=Babylonia areolata TaxID=304850 RepID=UPI003FD11B27
MFGNRRGNTGMVSLIIATFLCFGVDIVLSEKPARCGMFEYYDSNMDNCGPCREICQHMELTRTEKQCRAQCSDYLTAATCTYRQYYDEVVQNCAHCAELCVHSDIKGTTKQCSSRCDKYLKAENCTEDEYFDEMNTSCSACAQLCSQRDPRGDTTPECFHKCQKYLEKHPPGNIVMESRRRR